MIQKKQLLISVFTFIIFSILMMVQINIDTTTADFKVGGIINTSCAENINGEWASCNDALESGTRRGIRCSPCGWVNNLPFTNEPNLCKMGGDDEG